MAGVIVSPEEVQRKLSEYRLGWLFSHDQQWKNGRGWNADPGRKGLAGFISLALRASTGVLWEIDGGRTQDFLDLHDPRSTSAGAVVPTVSRSHVQFERAGRRCIFGIDSHGRIDRRLISDPHYIPGRTHVQLAVTLRGAFANATVDEMLKIGGDWGFRFLPLTE